MFRQFGEVIKFRLVIDPMTGKGKGYGFCDFVSPDSAEAAKRMNDVLTINGRKLRVDNAAQGAVQGGYGGGLARTSGNSSLKQARDLDTALAQLTMGEVYDVLVEVKAWVKKDPEAVRELLSQRPVLAQALLKMQTTMGMLQTAPPADQSFGAFASGASSGSQNSTTSAVTQPIPMPSMPSASTLPPGYPPQYYAAAPLPYPITAYPPPSMPGIGQAAGLPGLQGGQPENIQEILRRVLMMSEEDVARLSPQEQAYVRSIRMQSMPR